MSLSTIQIMTLLQISPSSTTSIFTIANYACCNCNVKINSLDDLLTLVMDLKEDCIINQFPKVNLDALKKAEDEAKQIIRTKTEEGITLFSYYERGYPIRLRNLYDANGLFTSPLLYGKRADEPLEKCDCYITIPEVNRLVGHSCPNCPNITFLKD